MSPFSLLDVSHIHQRNCLDDAPMLPEGQRSRNGEVMEQERGTYRLLVGTLSGFVISFGSLAVVHALFTQGTTF